MAISSWTSGGRCFLQFPSKLIIAFTLQNSNIKPAVLQEEYDVEHGQERPHDPEDKVDDEPVLLLDDAAEGHAHEEADGEEAVHVGQAPGPCFVKKCLVFFAREIDCCAPVLLCRHVRYVGIAAEEEAGVAAGTVLQALEQKIFFKVEMWEINVTDLKEDVLRLQLVPPDRVDDVHAVVQEVAAAGHDHERPPPVGVGPGPGEEGVRDRRDGLF